MGCMGKTAMGINFWPNALLILSVLRREGFQPTSRLHRSSLETPKKRKDLTVYGRRYLARRHRLEFIRVLVLQCNHVRLSALKVVDAVEEGRSSDTNRQWRYSVVSFVEVSRRLVDMQ